MENNDFLNDAKRRRKTTRCWASDNGLLWPSPNVIQKMNPAYYDIENSNSIGIYFKEIDIKSEPSFLLNDETFKKVIGDFTSFITAKESYSKYGFQYKRGMMLHGEPGTGKSSLVRILIEKAIKLNAIVLKFDNPEVFEAGATILREIHPDQFIVSVMEDFDDIWRTYNETRILNLLDGITSINNILYLATTNNLKDIDDKIKNRPSRFDRKYYIGPLTDSGKIDLLKELLKGDKLKKFTEKEWTTQTKGMTNAQLKEVFISCIILGKSFSDSVSEVRTHGEKTE